MFCLVPRNYDFFENFGKWENSHNLSKFKKMWRSGKHLDNDKKCELN